MEIKFPLNLTFILLVYIRNIDYPDLLLVYVRVLVFQLKSILSPIEKHVHYI